MKASVQISTTHIGHQTRPSITLKLDGGRYMFNCPEGLQRFSYSQAIRFSKLRGVFLSRMNLDCIGGLPGMILTVSDSNSVSRLDIVGPSGLTHYIAASHDFVVRKNIQMFLKEVHTIKEIREGSSEEAVNEEEAYKDENISVSAVKLLPDHVSEELFRKRTVALRKDLPRKKRIVNQMFESRILSDEEGVLDEIPGTDEADNSEHQKHLHGTSASLCYIIQGPTVPGKFDAKKATELGIVGIDRGKLAKGETITLPSGTVVQPLDVIAKARPGSILVFLDVPQKSYLNSLLTEERLQAVLLDIAGGNRPKIVIHQLGDGVLEDERYQQWINRFCSGVQNVIVAPGLHANENAHEASSLFLSLLSNVEDKVFPQLPKLQQKTSLPHSLLKMNPPCVAASQLMEFQLEPTPKFLPIPSSKNPVIPSSNDLESISNIIQHVNSIPENSNYVGEYVLPLGTGSAIPARYRNVSGTWFHHADGAILFDAGEGTLGQMERRFGSDLSARLQSLKVIFVSHQHGDHQLGVASVLRAWINATERLVDRKLFVIAPSPFLSWLKNVAVLEDLRLPSCIEFITCSSLVVGPFQKQIAGRITDSLYKHVNLKSFCIVPVKHCKLSFATSVEYNSGFKVSFSGDCRPSTDFADIGQNSDLLIHEATLPNYMLQDAIKKRHCTFSEAIQVGERMKAKHVLLTHFSQRLPKFVSVPDTEKSPCVIGVASDLLQVHMKDFAKLAALNNSSLTSFFGLEQEEGLELNEEVA